MSATVSFTFLRSAWLCLLMLSSIPAMADVYTYVDGQGNRVFTDQPHKNARRVDIPPSNSTTGTPPKRTVQSSPAMPKYKAMFRYELLRVLVPEPDATVRSTPGDMIVTVTSDPALQSGHNYQLLIDGAPTAAPGRSPVFALQNIDRGTHQLSVLILDEKGRVLERTPNQPFHMQRISLAQKRTANPCQLPEYGVRPECPIKDKPEEKSSFFPFF